MKANKKLVTSTFCKKGCKIIYASSIIKKKKKKPFFRILGEEIPNAA